MSLCIVLSSYLFHGTPDILISDKSILGVSMEEVQTNVPLTADVLLSHEIPEKLGCQHAHQHNPAKPEEEGRYV